MLHFEHSDQSEQKNCQDVREMEHFLEKWKNKTPNWSRRSSQQGKKSWSLHNKKSRKMEFKLYLYFCWLLTDSNNSILNIASSYNNYAILVMSGWEAIGIIS